MSPAYRTLPTPPLQTSPQKSHATKPSITLSPRAWLAKTTPANGNTVAGHVLSHQRIISDPKFLDGDEVIHAPRSGALGSGATIVRTPQEALATSASAVAEYFREEDEDPKARAMRREQKGKWKARDPSWTSIQQQTPPESPEHDLPPLPPTKDHYEIAKHDDASVYEVMSQGGGNDANSQCTASTYSSYTPSVLLRDSADAASDFSPILVSASTISLQDRARTLVTIGSFAHGVNLENLNSFYPLQKHAPKLSRPRYQLYSQSHRIFPNSWCLCFRSMTEIAPLLILATLMNSPSANPSVKQRTRKETVNFIRYLHVIWASLPYNLVLCHLPFISS